MGWLEWTKWCVFALLSENDWWLVTGIWIATQKRVKCTRIRKNQGILNINYGTCINKISIENYLLKWTAPRNCEVVQGIQFQVCVIFSKMKNLCADNQGTPFSSLTNFISKSERTQAKEECKSYTRVFTVPYLLLSSIKWEINCSLFSVHHHFMLFCCLLLYTIHKLMCVVQHIL